METWLSTWKGFPLINGFFFFYVLSFWRRWGSFLGTLDTILGILGSRGTPNGHLEVQIFILLILEWIWEPSWSLLWAQFRDFLWFGVAEWETGSRSMFLVIQGWKWCQNAMAACARTIVKTMCFEWFYFFHLFMDLVSWGRDLGDILMSFGDPGDTFSDS